MIRLVWEALRGRRAQAATVFALTGLAVGTAAAAPWYVFATAEQLTGRYVADAPVAERVVHLRGERTSGDGPVDPHDVRARVDAIVGGHAGPVWAGRELTGKVINAGTAAAGDDAPVPTRLLSRDGVCDQVVVQGACPAGPDQAMITTAFARERGMAVGDFLSFKPEDHQVLGRYRITGIYRPAADTDAYWAGVWAHPDTELDPVFTTAEGIAAVPSVTPVTIVDLWLTPGAYADGLGPRLRDSAGTADGWKLTVDTAVGEVPVRAAKAAGTVSAAVVGATGRFVLLAWFALLVVVRHTVTDRRHDLALVKLRGVRRWRTWTLTLGQAFATMLSGALAGTALGVAGVWLLVGPVRRPDDLALALPQSAALFGGVLAAALLLAWFSELRSLRSPVVELLRYVPPRARRRAADIAEIIVALLLGIAVWQLSAGNRGGSVAATMVPALVAIAAGLIAARFVLWLAGAAGRGAMRTGSLAIALAGLTVRRRPTLRWVVTLIVVAVAGLATAAGEMMRADATARVRAEQQLGADRVLSVGAPSRSALLAAVRQADPDGRYAMAVSAFPHATGFSAGLIAVDSSRLANVAAWLPGYGPRPAAADAPDPGVIVPDGPVTLDASFDPRTRPDGLLMKPGENPSVLGTPIPPPSHVDADVYVRLDLVGPAGEPFSVAWGPLASGRETYAAKVEGCGGGCRFVDLALFTKHAGGFVQAPWGTQVVLHGLAAAGKPLFPAAAFTDRTAWSAPAATGAQALEIAATASGLALTVPPGCGPRGACPLSVLRPAAPLAAVVAGPVGRSGRNATPVLKLSGSGGIPVEVAGRAPALPRVGADGALVDLAQLDAALPSTAPGEQMEVWLAAGAPNSLVDSLRQAGLQIRGERTVGAIQHGLLDQAPARIRQFQLGVFALGVLIAAVALLLAAGVERADRARELSALRVQGLRLREVRRSGILGYAVPAFIGIVGGMIAAAAVGWLPATSPPLFADDWKVLSPPSGATAAGLWLAAGAAAIVVAAALAYSARRLVRASVPGVRGVR
ncbi:FtsX-like permease family protein [Hamadaea tsunoensis]|uniref:FtsX-like permease family protein n=1 Tax=Hamadaea tsunoensis TaxID=53368 RepID=UPI000406F7ED|nr:FtsX-like permease family protein [Hamadaea tsunoensis]